MTNEYKGYPLFNDVSDDLLRAWNRMRIAANIMQDVGDDNSKEYLENFNDTDLMQIELLALMASIHGEEEIQKQINEIMELENGTDEEPTGDSDEAGTTTTAVAEGQ